MEDCIRGRSIERGACDWPVQRPSKRRRQVFQRIHHRVAAPQVLRMGQELMIWSCEARRCDGRLRPQLNTMGCIQEDDEGDANHEHAAQLKKCGGTRHVSC